MKDFSIEVHGAHTYDATGAISEPIYLSATFRHPGFQQSTGYDYGRVANPTRAELESALTLLERGGRTWAMSSGMAAINIVFLLLSAGDHILFSNDLYGGTVRLANEVYARYGIEATYVDTSDLAAVKAALRPTTKLVYIETPSNPMMIISDIRALSDLAHENGALLAVDNTFLSPHFQKPLTLGADIVLHSGTKYLCGHNDVIAGFLTVADADSELAERIQRLVVSSGPNLGALDAWLMLRSLKTLGVRIERQAATAAKIADWLGTQQHVTHVYYPGLQNHPDYELQCQQATGFGGMVSFKVDSAERAQAVLGRLKLIAFAESLGGVESLLTYPKVQTHAEMPEELMKATGLDDKLLRLSVGLEDAADLIGDLEQALNG
ncbi:MAG: PLP-dependent aspartate aminotransferase family protein [Selenomonadaceae bacterium]|nr:PLP-dependent aspartate aminotransferase family protein [Selenomonadaceae bacterium]